MLKKLMSRLKSRKKDRGDAVLTTVLISIPLLCLVFAFSTSISMAVWQKTAYISAAQTAATDSLKAVQTNGFLGTNTIQKFVSEYLAQTGRAANPVLGAGQSAGASETAAFAGGVCSTAVINGVKRQLPYIEVELDLKRGLGTSSISTYPYWSAGNNGVVNAPVGGHGQLVYGQEYRVINAKVWEASRNVTWFGIPTSLQSHDANRACQPYNVDVSAILFGNNEDLTTNRECFQPDMVPVNPNVVYEVRVPGAQMKESPLASCAKVGELLPANSIVTVSGVYKEWSHVTTPNGTVGWVLTERLKVPSDWSITYYDENCSQVSSTCTLSSPSAVSPANPTSYNWGVNTADITLTNPTKANHQYGGWQPINCTTRAPLGGASKTATIPFGSYGNLCFKANFIKDRVWVTFNPDGGTGGAARKAYDYGTVVTAPACAVRAGYVFRGWQDAANTLIYTASTGAPCTLSPASRTITGVNNQEIVYRASWNAATYAINKNFTAGTSASGGVISYTFSPNAQTASLGGVCSAGYQSLVWSNPSAGSISGSTLNIPGGTTGAISVRAACTAAPYAIDVSSTAPSSSNVGTQATYTVVSGFNGALTRPARSGYTWGNWSIIAQPTNGTATINQSNNVLRVTPGSFGVVQVRANLTPQAYSITLNRGTVAVGAPGNNGAVSQSTYTTASAATIYLTRPSTPAGYNFSHWTISGGYTANNFTGSSFTIPAGSIGQVVVKANWKPIVYTVSFNPNGGTSVAARNYSISANPQNITPSAPTRTGFTFAGWNVTSGPTSGSITGGGNTTINAATYGNATLTAAWNAVSYNISYMCNGRGACAPAGAPSTYVYGTSPNIPNSYGGGQFDGWTLNDNSRSNMRTGTSTIPVGTAGNITLYAHWTYDLVAATGYGPSGFYMQCNYPNGSWGVNTNWCLTATVACPSGGNLALNGSGGMEFHYQGRVTTLPWGGWLSPYYVSGSWGNWNPALFTAGPNGGQPTCNGLTV